VIRLMKGDHPDAIGHMTTIVQGRVTMKDRIEIRADREERGRMTIGLNQSARRAEMKLGRPMRRGMSDKLNSLALFI